MKNPEFAMVQGKKNYVRDIAEFAPGELYTDQYKVKVNDLVSRSMTLFQGQGPRSIDTLLSAVTVLLYDLDHIPLLLYSVQGQGRKVIKSIFGYIPHIVF